MLRACVSGVLSKMRNIIVIVKNSVVALGVFNLLATVVY